MEQTQRPPLIGRPSATTIPSSTLRVLSRVPLLRKSEFTKRSVREDNVLLDTWTVRFRLTRSCMRINRTPSPANGNQVGLGATLRVRDDSAVLSRCPFPVFHGQPGPQSLAWF
jgi:hypothetical protein